MFCWDIFWKKQLVQKNADRKLSGEYHESVLNLMIPLMACAVYLGVRRFFVMHTNIRGAG